MEAGNRIKKVQHLDDFNWIEVDYTYDIENPDLYYSNNNRLMKYTTTQYQESFLPPPMEGAMMMSGGGPTAMLVSTTWYYYTPAGNVERVVTNQAGTAEYTASRMSYAANAQAVTFVAGESWTWDGQATSEPQDYAVSYVREFRYDGARQRYMSRELTPPPFGQVGFDYTILSDIWSDYDGNRIYGDYEVTVGSGFPPPEPEVTELRSFEPGIGQIDPWDVYGEPDYYHTDMIGTTRVMTGPQDPGMGNNVPVIEEAVYTAFGERISGAVSDLGDRYGYAGAWGYQAHEDFPYLHIGARYYDPATGRFLQRDPIGIVGGRNVYLYAGAEPLTQADPSGRSIIDDIDDLLDRIINGEPAVGVGVGTGVGTAVNFKYRLGIGRLLNRTGVGAAGVWIGWNAGKGVFNLLLKPVGDMLTDWLISRPNGPPGYPLPRIGNRPAVPRYIPPARCNRCFEKPRPPVTGCGW